MWSSYKILDYQYEQDVLKDHYLMAQVDIPCEVTGEQRYLSDLVMDWYNGSESQRQVTSHGDRVEYEYKTRVSKVFTEYFNHAINMINIDEVLLLL